MSPPLPPLRRFSAKTGRELKPHAYGWHTCPACGEQRATRDGKADGSCPFCHGRGSKPNGEPFDDLEPDDPLRKAEELVKQAMPGSKVVARRDRWGRYLLAPPGGGKPVAYTRVTTIAKTLDDQYGLGRWATRMTAWGLSQRPDLLAGVAAAGLDDKGGLDRICDDAKEAAAGSAGANLGTALHKFTQNVDEGLVAVDDIPEQWRATIAAYRDALAANGIEVDPKLVEVLLVDPERGIAGTADRIVTVGGERFIADVKTGKDLSYSWLSIAIQLSLYADSPHLLDLSAGKYSPAPEVSQERALVIHLRDGLCDLYWVDLNAGAEAARLALQVREWRGRKQLSQPWTDSEAVDVVAVRRQRLAARIDVLRGMDGALDALARRWPPGVPTLKGCGDHTAAQLDLIDDALCAVEDKFQAPFGGLDPNSSISGVNKRKGTAA